MDDPAYNLTVGLGILELIGPDLYSNLPAVFAEMIANAWDADAKNVWLKVDISNGCIQIEDDGNGMSLTDLNEKFLHIAYKKRKNPEDVFTPGGRHVMGRKGIGKLAFFSLGEKLSIETSDGNTKAGCKIDWSQIRDAISQDKPYQPEPIPPDQIRGTKGTKITLVQLDIEKTKGIVVGDLRKAIARRFTVLDNNHHFTLEIEGTPVTDKDRPFLKQIEYLWHFEDNHNINNKTPHALRRAPLLGSIKVNGESCSLRGWIGTVQKPAMLKSGGNNTISLYAHGKLIQEDILQEVAESLYYSEYIVGEIDADFLDADDADDIVTSDRQRVKQNDPRYTTIKNFIGNLVRKEIRDAWSLWRLEDAIPEYLANLEIFAKYQKLSKTAKEEAARQLKRIKSLTALRDEQEKLSIIPKCAEFLTSSKIKWLKSLSDDELLSELDGENDTSTSVTSTAKNETTASTSSTDQGSETTSPADRTDSQPKTEAQKESTQSANKDEEKPKQEDSKQSNKNKSDKNEADETYPAKTSRPKDEAAKYFGELNKLVRKSLIEEKLQTIILYDLDQANKAFYNSVFKACAVMLGAALEGIMLGTLRRKDVVEYIQSHPDYPKILNKIGINQSDICEIQDNLSKDFKFEDMRQVIRWLMPDHEQFRVEDIQVFRNIIHPGKALQEPMFYSDIPETRASNLMTSLVILSKQILEWNP